MNDFQKILEITSSMKGFVIPPPEKHESACAYHARIVNAISDYFILVSAIHAIAYRNKS